MAPKQWSVRTLATIGAASVGLATLAAFTAGPAQAEPAPPEGTTVSTVQSTLIDAASGLVLGEDSNSYWVQQDAGWYAAHKGQPAAIWLIGPDGNIRTTVRPVNTVFEDAEDLAMGTGPDGSWLYVADTGDASNVRAKTKVGPRQEFSIYRVPTPVGASDGAVVDTQSQRLRFTYPDTATHNSEAMLVDPADGSVLLVEKGTTTPTATVWAVPSNAWDSATPVVARSVGTVPMAAATGAAVDPQRRFLVIRGHNRAVAFPIARFQSLEAALKGRPAAFLLPVQQQGEGIGINPAIPGIVVNSEGLNQPIKAVAMPANFLKLINRGADSPPGGGPLVGIVRRLIITLAIAGIAAVALFVIRRRRRKDAALIQGLPTEIDLRDHSDERSHR